MPLAFRAFERSHLSAAEAFFSSLEWEVLSIHEFANTSHAQAVVLDWCYGFYDHDLRHIAGHHQPERVRS